MVMQELLQLIEDEQIAAPSPIEQRWSAARCVSSYQMPLCGIWCEGRSLHFLLGAVLTAVLIFLVGHSSSPMSPAYSPVPEDLFSWVGIIMYLPSEDPAVREAISARWVAPLCVGQAATTNGLHMWYTALSIGTCKPATAQQTHVQLLRCGDVNMHQACSGLRSSESLMWSMWRSFNNYVDLAEEEVLSEHGAVDHWAKVEVGRMPPNKLQQKLAARYPVADFNAARASLDPKNILSNPLLDAMFPRTDV